MNVIPLEATWISQIGELWNQELGDRFPLREALLRQNSFQDKNVYNPASWLAHDDDGTLIGFVIAKKWQELEREMQLGEGAGWIQAIVVRSEARGQGIGSRLLSLAEEALRKSGVRLVYMGRDPWHYFPGVPKALSSSREWCEHKGYEQLYEVFDLLATREADNTMDSPRFEGAYVRLLEQEDQAEMLRFFRRCFPGRWYYEALHYWERGGTGREFMALFADQEMIGFCRVNDEHAPLIAQNTYWAPLFAEPLGGIGPLGVDDRYRGRGYGLGLVQAGMKELEARGMKHLIIDWTELVDFYAKLGFRKWKGYDLMKKELL